MTSNMHQYKRDQLYLPTASRNPPATPQTYAGDYQNYKKESAFRRLVGGALRNPMERHRRQPSSSEYENKRQTIAGPPRPAPPPEPPIDRPKDEDRERRRRPHRKSTYSEAPRQPPKDEYNYRRGADDRRWSKQSVRPRELKPLSSNPVSGADPSSYRPVNPKAENRATVDARRPYTTERLSRASHHSRRRD